MSIQIIRSMFLASSCTLTYDTRHTHSLKIRLTSSDEFGSQLIWPTLYHVTIFTFYSRWSRPFRVRQLFPTRVTRSANSFFSPQLFKHFTHLHSFTCIFLSLSPLSVSCFSSPPPPNIPFFIVFDRKGITMSPYYTLCTVLYTFWVNKSHVE